MATSRCHLIATLGLIFAVPAFYVNAEEPVGTCAAGDTKCIKEQRTKLLELIKASPTCDDHDVTVIYADVPLDEEIVLQALKSGCVSIFRHPAKIEEKDTPVVDSAGNTVRTLKQKVSIGESKTFPKTMEWITNDRRKHAMSAVEKYIKYAEASILPSAKKSNEGKGDFLAVEENVTRAKNGFRMASNPLTYLDCYNETHPKNECDSVHKMQNRVGALESQFNRMAEQYEKQSLAANASGDSVEKICPLFNQLGKWVTVNPQGEMRNCMGDSCPPGREPETNIALHMKIASYVSKYNMDTKGDHFDFRKCRSK